MSSESDDLPRNPGRTDASARTRKPWRAPAVIVATNAADTDKPPYHSEITTFGTVHLGPS